MNPMQAAAVFLDRDGVLNRIRVERGLPVGPMTLAEFELIEGVTDAVIRLKAAGFKVVVVTNQPEISRGRLSPDVLDAMHAKLRALVPVDAIYVCPHDDRDSCGCRKPKPGMLVAAAEELGIDLQRSYMVGDRWRDVEAGKAAGCRTYLVDRGYRDNVATAPDHVAANLADAVSDILKRKPDFPGR